MRRPAVLLVMLLAMLWQPLVMARAGSTVNPLVDLAHATLHWQKVGHHHHEDGSYHQDDSAESVQHMAADQLNASLALPALPLHDVPPVRSAAPDSLRLMRVPSPTLDGLLRPPRARA